MCRGDEIFAIFDGGVINYDISIGSKEITQVKYV